MPEHQSFSESIYEEQARLAERELSSFLAAVTELYGPEQARLSAKDWLDESEFIDEPPLSTERNWRGSRLQHRPAWPIAYRQLSN